MKLVNAARPGVAASEPEPEPGSSLHASQQRSRIDRVGAERAVADLLRALGQDLDDPQLRETPRRVAASLSEMLSPAAFNPTTFPNDDHCDELVVARDIPMRSLCAHHLLPFV